MERNGERLKELVKEQEKGCNDKCPDFDEDCFAVENPLHCFTYIPCKGYCPLLYNEN